MLTATPRGDVVDRLYADLSTCSDINLDILIGKPPVIVQAYTDQNTPPGWGLNYIDGTSLVGDEYITSFE